MLATRPLTPQIKIKDEILTSRYCNFPPSLGEMYSTVIELFVDRHEPSVLSYLR